LRNNPLVASGRSISWRQLSDEAHHRASRFSIGQDQARESAARITASLFGRPRRWRFLHLFHRLAQRAINPRLVARPRPLEPGQQIGIQLQADQLFPRLLVPDKVFLRHVRVFHAVHSDWSCRLLTPSQQQVPPLRRSPLFAVICSGRDDRVGGSQNPRSTYPFPLAASTARSTACALFMDS